MSSLFSVLTCSVCENKRGLQRAGEQERKADLRSGGSHAFRPKVKMGNKGKFIFPDQILRINSC